MSHILPPLPYAFNALEPYIDAQTMGLHHDKHHATYTQKLNEAVTGTKWQDKNIEQLLANLDQLPEEIRQKVRNHGGGYVNHNLYWQCLSPQFDQTIPPPLATKINANFGSMSEFKTQFTQAAMTQFGSGWAFLVKKPDSQLAVYSLSNQDSPITLGDKPLLALDVWEHAYYLKYQNRRDEYVANFWHVINWQDISKLL